MRPSLGWRREEHLSSLKLMAASLAHCHSGRGETWIAGSAAVEAQAAAQQTGWIAQPEDYLQVQIAVGQGW